VPGILKLMSTFEKGRGTFQPQRSSAWYVFNLEGRVHLDVPPACDPVSREGMKTHDLSIPTNPCPALPPLPQ
jgi:hypothetical protein